MAKFTLKQGNDNFDFDPFGPVKDKNGNKIGSWTTDKSNKIVVKKDAGGADLIFPVDWHFNANNQLCIQSGGQDVFNFQVDSNQPIYKTVDAVLNVKSDRNNAFNFNLRGTWDMSNNHDLSVTINGVKSTFDGFLQDPQGRFMYHFFNKQDPSLTQESILGFVGKWEPGADANTSKPVTFFRYRREGDAQGTFSGTFTLPQGLTVHRNFNQFMYQYDKNGRTSQLVIIGEMTVTENFQIKYLISQQKSKGQEQVASTSFTLDAELTTKKFTGDLELTIKKVNGANVQANTLALGLSGQFTAQLGSVTLQTAYSFTQVRGNNAVTTAFGFNGSLAFKNGEFVWAFERNAQQTTISVEGNIKVGAARIDERLNIHMDGNKVVGVQVLFGVAF